MPTRSEQLEYARLVADLDEVVERYRVTVPRASEAMPRTIRLSVADMRRLIRNLQAATIQKRLLREEEMPPSPPTGTPPDALW